MLKDLNLSSTAIHKLPNFKAMKYIENCDLSNMIIDRVPDAFIYSNMEILTDDIYDEYQRLRLDNTKIQCQPYSLFTHNKEFIKAYYEEEKIHLNESKVVFLGDGEAGKSYIIERIKQNNKKLKVFEENSTPGIAISQKHCEIDDENICLQIWDFGGQEIMHSMHRFFLTERTLYVIVINARDNIQDERAKYWMNNIKNFASGCPVIIVLNKMDQNPAASMNERLIMDDYPQMVNILKMSALHDDESDFNKLMHMIISEIKKFDSYAMDFPISWNNIKITLTEMKANYITDSQYREICKTNGLDDEQMQDWLLDWFHDLGVSFNYHKKDILLSGYMVLKPTWITNAIYIIMFNGSKYANRGIIEIKDIVKLLKNPPRFVEDIKYETTEVSYILAVMRRFEISYSINSEKEFVPMMCEKNQHEDSYCYTNGDCLEYYMEYEYLPNNVLHKLMIKMHKDLIDDKIWLTGMILHSRNKNISAFVRMHDKYIEIFIKNYDDVAYPKKEYLAEIREHLISINAELNLHANDVIIYKEDDLSEKIAYSSLLIYLSAKQTDYFSTVFKKMIPIKKILGVIENENETELIMEYCNENGKVSNQDVNNMLKKARYTIADKDFKEELLKCCMQLQGNSLQILKADENDRNTYLRDLLTVNNKFIVCDQSLNGMSAKGKKAGELDLLIKNHGQSPISIVEALTLKAVDKRYISDHIDKLLKSYDTWGLHNNYVINYVETNNFLGFSKRYKSFIANYEYIYGLQNITNYESNSEIIVYDVK